MFWRAMLPWSTPCQWSVAYWQTAIWVCARPLLLVAACWCLATWVWPTRVSKPLCKAKPLFGMIKRSVYSIYHCHSLSSVLVFSNRISLPLSVNSMRKMIPAVTLVSPSSIWVSIWGHCAPHYCAAIWARPMVGVMALVRQVSAWCLAYWFSKRGKTIYRVMLSLMIRLYSNRTHGLESTKNGLSTSVPLRHWR